MTKRGFLEGYATYEGEPGNPNQWRAAFAATMGLDEARQRVGHRSPKDILGVALNATWKQVVAGYRRAMLAVHPDRCAFHGLPVDVATERSKEVQAAYVVLKAQYGQ